MQKDRLVIDIETKNSFADVGGQDKVRNLDCSLIGVYSYNENRFLSVREGHFDELAAMLREAGCIVGFSINRFDIPVMEKYYDFDLFAIPRIDLLEEIENRLGRRVSLDLLARENLKIGKTGHGLDAIKYYAAGDWEALEKYCLQDVLITRDLYDLAMKQKYLMVPDKWGAPRKVELILKEPVMEKAPNTLF
ncbi:MAG: hypothetical protein A3B23_01460 [Candidatus Colwellbacteria bacterium RIFCSPLOWO2_01_FULL_48_10]|uniref:YprB ribonuclease H-like domain-containing protein n=2 Tax=Bacteria candidate phyla TaxID=1783234 RepID=A0A1F5P3U4_9BACT|nr:MAG: hypothetical protein A2846_04275 [Candidatus Doudnabacteria bacterium RIFCSPHIGHO2_01_FULL_49_9]OGY59079.1 MAG: hypothetical protein A3B23_01460 [Candidatus Colwellbacteria bacterium RIFCSPLOWO2_01_FULL_48_10]